MIELDCSQTETIAVEFLYNKEIDRQLSSLCESVGERAVFISAFVKNDSFEKYSNRIGNDKSVSKVLFVRWRLSDLVTGASDTQVYQTARALGWKVYLHQDLHAKVYVLDKRVLMGSANLTMSGMQLNLSSPNLETMLLTDTQDELESWMSSLIENSIYLDDELFERIQADVDKHPKQYNPSISYSTKVLGIIAARQKSPQFYTADMLWSESPTAILNGLSSGTLTSDVEHDLGLLQPAEPYELDKLREAFKLSISWRWLIKNASEPIYFGELSSKLHDALQDDPKVYRKTVKSLLTNLLNWAQACVPESINIDAPNYSQRIEVMAGSDY